MLSPWCRLILPRQDDMLAALHESLTWTPIVTQHAGAGLTQPHPNSACVLVDQQGQVRAEAYQHAQVRELSTPMVQVSLAAIPQLRWWSSHAWQALRVLYLHIL